MGIYNSSIYRIRPLAKEIDKDPRNLVELLKLVELDGKPSLANLEINGLIETFYSEGQTINGQGKNEKALRPPMEHLTWMAKNFNLCKVNPSEKGETKENRQLLRNGDQPQINKACSLIKYIYTLGSSAPSSWYILEGDSSPDLFIETADSIIVIEAKWTESAITTTTTYLEHRNQLVRHIQGALEYNRVFCDNKKRVVGFYIVEEDFLRKNDHQMTVEGFSNELLNETVPILNKQEIIDCYKGYTTWEKIQHDPNIKNVVFLTKNMIENKTAEKTREIDPNPEPFREYLNDLPQCVSDVLGRISEDIYSDEIKSIATEKLAGNKGDINYIPSSHRGKCNERLIAVCYDGDDLELRLRTCLDHASITCSGINRDVYFITTKWDSTLINKYEGYFNALRNSIRLTLIYVTKKGSVLMPN